LHRDILSILKRFNKGVIDADTSYKIEKPILEDEFDDPEFLNFAIENYSKMLNKLTL
jgi:hypothetical protein